MGDEQDAAPMEGGGRREYMQKNSRKVEVSGSSVMSVDAAWACACMCMCVYSPTRGGIACQI